MRESASPHWGITHFVSVHLPPPPDCDLDGLANAPWCQCMGAWWVLCCRRAGVQDQAHSTLCTELLPGLFKVRWVRSQPGPQAGGGRTLPGELAAQKGAA